jgi:23S rRNA pseudouridine1911/1915/1917 synthase
VSECDIWVKQIVHPDGAACRTSFRVLNRFAEGFSLIEAKPETGRMHQIRVHLHHLGLPMVGDKLYGRDDRCYLEFIDTGWTPSLQKRLLIPRQALHSKRLELTAEGFHGAWEAPVPDFLAMIGPP